MILNKNRTGSKNQSLVFYTSRSKIARKNDLARFQTVSRSSTPSSGQKIDFSTHTWVFDHIFFLNGEMQNLLTYSDDLCAKNSEKFKNVCVFTGHIGFL